jgi:hypothetical protein
MTALAASRLASFLTWPPMGERKPSHGFSTTANDAIRRQILGPGEDLPVRKAAHFPVTLHAYVTGCRAVIHLGSALNLRRIVCCLLLVCARLRSGGRACCAWI